MKYFAYGSNLHPARLRKRAPSAEVIGVVQLVGWHLRFHKRSKDGSGKCNIIRTDQPTNVVYGVVYEIDPMEKGALDRAEGLGYGYDESRLPIDGYKDVFCYTASEVDDSLERYTWYQGYVIVGARYHGLPEAYVQGIEIVEGIQDPDEARHLTNMQILEGLQRI
ncbi:MAG TPA: gamma-glutamylcyclotransferase [Gammaproteobacteria bacterium]|nr:gamma-glutamylcyclotransferase [Gammaproteobacteria bacterium]